MNDREKYGYAVDKKIDDSETIESVFRIKKDILKADFHNDRFLVAYLDGNFNFIMVNKAYAKASGQTPGYFTGKNLFKLYPDNKNEDTFCNVVKTGEPHHEFAKPFEYFNIHDSGITYWDWSVLPVKDPQGKVTSLVMNLIDVTDRVEGQKRIDAYITELERKNKELEEFAYVASHDLQEPLRKIQMFGELVLERFRHSFPPGAIDYLDRMVNAATRMRSLIDSLLSYSRVTSRAKPFQMVDLGEITQEALLNLEASIEERNAVIEVDVMPVIEADSRQMLQLMQNLIANGLKFQKEREIPHIKIWTETVSTSNVKNPDKQADGDMCVIMVKDNGIGFEDKYLDRMLIAFQRLHDRDAFEGVGIGLAICRKIVERHNGTITAKSTPGRGSTFIIQLPYKQWVEVYHE